MSKMDTKQYVTVTEAARLLRCSRTLVYRALKEGKLHYVDATLQRRGGKRISRAELLALLPPEAR